MNKYVEQPDKGCEKEGDKGSDDPLQQNYVIGKSTKPAQGAKSKVLGQVQLLECDRPKKNDTIDDKTEEQIGDEVGGKGSGRYRVPAR